MRPRFAFLLPLFLAAPIPMGAADAPTSVDTQPPAKIVAAVKGEKKSELGQCVDRGLRYFQIIDAWPTLTSGPNAGRDAESVAIERCRRSFRAF